MTYDTVSKSDRLRLLLAEKSVTKALGAHSALTALLVEEAKFDVVWASGLEISAARAVPDANILSAVEVLDAAAQMAEAVSIPVLADCDSGFGNVNNVIHTVRSFERRGIAGICIEDKLYPKLNSFAEGPQLLAPITDFAGRIHAAAAERSELVIVARIEALIAGQGLDEALLRGRAYAAAGADALLIHSKSPEPAEVFAFRDNLDVDIPVIVVPTTYHRVTIAELAEHGFAMAIYANHVLRSSIRAVQATAARIAAEGTTANVESELTPVSEVFRLQGLFDMLKNQECHESVGREIAASVEKGKVP
ncbi:isocitrate lyase/phosphoenolpyruvate mutase family protein [Rathayibacter toxicus]|uniref:isocitrate lyase/phosphoenolpyruvate mutase family protein n=1 Tax=Rathayibacter toxicus TaxID=145458 RepID=UPI000CE7D8FE|nr:isocitrate lyase/phosphoenolpyruvate mutase family protein [Rathayibacter toxicus]PPI56031.1 phosphoenolpyruvate phosphomutase [Rathayibacter toxicus]QOD10179.1 isocitrate lyase/phosphoenolpyruvate mutase family protein [Rathayibacter toxicus]QWL28855.1 phosphoenolpyruvate phosphomutase [Rathayibacter toxicus]QWL33042.1 phosphoenolpyruvate phosphomutase [Rathayibacter toxicus]QWL35136.1 phosphoenolpyruvate phosphomutase [Rathayibacter toxicus]